MTHDQSRRYSRRTFLKTAAFTSSVLAVPGLLPAAQAAAATPTAQRSAALRTNVGIVVPQHQAVLCPRSQHTIGIGNAFRNQIIN